MTSIANGGMSNSMNTKRYDFRKLRILVIDDCKFMRKVMDRMLRVLGVEHVGFAKDGYDGLHECYNFKPDIVISDWEMSPMDGEEFVEKLRNDETSPDPLIPVIMLTAYTEKRRVLAARDFGVTEFVAKPVSARVLYSRLVSVIENPRSYVRSNNFFGPDRRRLRSMYSGDERRYVETASNSKK